MASGLAWTSLTEDIPMTIGQDLDEQFIMIAQRLANLEDILWHRKP